MSPRTYNGADTHSAPLQNRSGALVLHLLEAATDLGGPETPVPTEGANRCDLPGTGPPGDGLGVHPEESSHFRRGEECVGLVLICHRGIPSESVPFVP